MVRTRVLIVDDHPLVREGLRDLVDSQPDLVVCGEAADGAGALAALDACAPDVVVLDLTLGADDGIALVERLLAARPGLPILVLSMHDEALYAERMIALGARGYVMKHEAADAFVGALRRVAAGEHHVSAALAARLYGRVARPRGVVPRGDGLTEREREVLRSVAAGLATQEIAAALGMSVKTVDSHRRNIRRKLGLVSAGDLVRYAVQWESGRPTPADA